MFHNFLTNESRKYYIQKMNKDNNNIPERDIIPKYTNINKEIKKKSNDLRKCFNIKNTIFKEMQSKQNSLTYKQLITCLGKYFFGPNGVVTEKYKFLRDYYEEKNLKIGLNNRIYAGTLDYFFLLSRYNSLSQRLNFTKEKLLSLSNNLAVASSAFDKVNQQAINNVNFQKRKKNYVYLNIKNSFPGKNLIKNNKEINKENSLIKNIIKNKKKLSKIIGGGGFDPQFNNSKSFSDNNETTINKDENNNLISINSNSFIQTPPNIYNNTFNHKGKEKEKIFFSKEKENNIFKIKLKKIKTNYKLKNNQNNKTPDISLSNNNKQKNSFLNKTIIYKYKNKSNINILKHKLKSIKRHNDIIQKINYFSSSFPKIKSYDDKIKDSSEIFSVSNIKDTLEEKINPILILNENSYKKLSYIKNHHLNSKNDIKIQKIINKKEILGVLRDKEYFRNIQNIKMPKYSSIELPNKIKNLTIKKKYNVEYE